MNITHTIKVRMTNVLLALLLVCGASSVSVQSAQASTDDNFPKILDSVSLVVNIIEEKIAEEGVPLAQSSTVATDPTIASLIALLNQLIAQYQALLAAQGTTNPVVATPVSTTSTWTKCADEGGWCTFSGTKQVRYGAGTTFVTKTLSNGVRCDNNTFGDPVFGTAKKCEVSGATTQTTTSVPVQTSTTNPVSTATPTSEVKSTTAHFDSLANQRIYTISGTADGSYVYLARGVSTTSPRVKVSVVNGKWSYTFANKMFQEESVIGGWYFSLYASASGSERRLDAESFSFIDVDAPAPVITPVPTITSLESPTGEVIIRFTKDFNTTTRPAVVGEKVKVEWSKIQNTYPKYVYVALHQDRDGNGTFESVYRIAYFKAYTDTTSVDQSLQGVLGAYSWYSTEKIGGVSIVGIPSKMSISVEAPETATDSKRIGFSPVFMIKK